MFLLKYIFKLIKALNSKSSVTQLAIGSCFGLLIGFCPKISPQGIFLLFLLYFFNANIPIAMITALLFSLLSNMVVPLTIYIGEALLTNPALEKLWETLYNTPIIPYTKFNNTAVMGELILSLILLIPVFFISKFLIIQYRSKIQSKLEKTRIAKIFKASKIYKLYSKFQDIKNA